MLHLWLLNFISFHKWETQKCDCHLRRRYIPQKKLISTENWRRMAALCLFTIFGKYVMQVFFPFDVTQYYRESPCYFFLSPKTSLKITHSLWQQLN